MREATRSRPDSYLFATPKAVLSYSRNQLVHNEMKEMKLIIALLLIISTAHAYDCTKIGNYTMCSDGRSAVDIGNTRMHSDGLTETRIGNQVIRSDGTMATDIGNYRIDDGPNGDSVQIGNMRMYDSGITCTNIGSYRVCD